VPTRRSQRTLLKPATREYRIDHRDMDREEESADTKTSDEYSPGERYQTSPYLAYLCTAQVSFLNHPNLIVSLCSYVQDLTSHSVVASVDLSVLYQSLCAGIKTLCR
jgi:hypothetical protein